MPAILFNAQFLLIAAINLFLFLIVATWSFLPIVLVDLGADNVDVGLVMGSIGITSLGSLPILAPLIDKHGRKIFIVGGILIIGFTNAGFLLFKSYSPLMIFVRLVQGIAFSACFNGCATAIVDLLRPEERAQGIGLFGVSGSIAVAVGPFLGERVMLSWGTHAYFLLLVGFGLIGFLAALTMKEAGRATSRSRMRGFFPTAFQDGHLSMMIMAVIFGSGFAAMNTFFPLYAKSLGFRAGIFFVCYGASLLVVRITLGSLADRIDRGKLIFACLIGFSILLVSTSQMDSITQSIFLGALFGVIQGLSYPAMMAKMVDRSNAENRAVVVALFTGSFGVGINASVVVWGAVAKIQGLSFMFLLGGLLMLLTAGVCTWLFFSGVQESRAQFAMLERPRDPTSFG
jgi:MFS family permease